METYFDSAAIGTAAPSNDSEGHGPGEPLDRRHGRIELEACFQFRAPPYTTSPCRR